MTINCQKYSGMSLIETMIAMVVFMVLALGITSAVIQSRQISQNNILRNTVYTASQGYLEQIKSLSLSEIRASIDDPDDVPLPTMSISSLDTGDVEIQDPIYLDGPSKSLSGQNDGSNFRELLIDLQPASDDSDLREVTMEVWFDVDIEEVGSRSHSYAITVRFEAYLRGRSQGRISGQIRGIRSDLNESASF